MHAGENARYADLSARPRRFRAARICQLYLDPAWPLFPRRPRFRRGPRVAPAIPVQLVLDFTGRVVITPLMEKLEGILRRMAKSGEALPINPVLAELANSGDRSGVFKALARLQRFGRLRVQVQDGRRRVVFTGGLATGWGEYRKGHKPYCRTPKGEPRPQKAAIPREAAKPMPSVAPSAVYLGFVDTCTWPMWADGERPNGRYCDAPVKRGRSFCPMHDVQKRKSSLSAE